MFALDIKIFHVIKEIHDTNKLQEDINKFSDWCHKNSLTLNISICKIMSFHRKRSPILFAYNINNTELLRVNEITDLGITYTVNMSFNNHIDKCIAKANYTFGFDKRWTNEFTD